MSEIPFVRDREGTVPSERDPRFVKFRGRRPVPTDDTNRSSILLDPDSDSAGRNLPRADQRLRAGGGGDRLSGGGEVGGDPETVAPIHQEIGVEDGGPRAGGGVDLAEQGGF